MLSIKDIVKVQSVPSNSKFVNFVGKFGYVEGINPAATRVLFQGLTKEGRLSGSPVWLPVSSLVKDHSQEWQIALVKYHEWKKQIQEEVETSNNERNEFLEKLAQQYGLTVNKVLEISKAVHDGMI